SRSDGLDSEAGDRDGDGGHNPARATTPCPVASKRLASLPAEVAGPRERRPSAGVAAWRLCGMGDLLVEWRARARRTGAGTWAAVLARRTRAPYGPTEGAR